MEIITNVQFDEVVSKGVVVIDFFANWCGPCKMLAPVLEEVAQELPTVTFAKVDVDQDPSLAGKYGIQSIPHLILFKDGQAVDQISGFVGKDVILEICCLIAQCNFINIINQNLFFNILKSFIHLQNIKK